MIYFDKLSLATEFSQSLTVAAAFEGISHVRADAKTETLIRVFPFLGRFSLKPDGPMRWRCADADNPKRAIVFTQKGLAESQIRDWVLEELGVVVAPESAEG